jgi:hypothetical protein
MMLYMQFVKQINIKRSERLTTGEGRRITLLYTINKPILPILVIPQLQVLRIPTLTRHPPSPSPPLRIKHRNPLRRRRPARSERSTHRRAHRARDDGNGEEEDVRE